MTTYTQHPLTVPQFQQKWRDSRLTERSAAQQHFLDLCRLLGMPSPAEADQEGAFYSGFRPVLSNGVHLRPRYGRSQQTGCVARGLGMAPCLYRSGAVRGAKTAAT
jgi:hypothetical protein